MDGVLLLIVAASGLRAAVPPPVATRTTYYFYYEPKSMSEAQSYCRETYTDLATIHSTRTMDVLNKVVDLEKMVYSKNRAWIGLHTSWRWSLSDTEEGFGDNNFRHWMPGKPDNAGGTRLCTVMTDDGSWNDMKCNKEEPVICCDVRGPNVTFVLINTPLSWPAAQSYCREQHTDLASVRNKGENQRIKKMIKKGEIAWIGLFRESWKWSDGSKSSFKFWKPSEPDNNHGDEMCVAANFDNSGKWEDRSCDEKRASICYQQDTVVTKQVVRLSLKKSSSLDLNDPAVMEDVLKKLRRRLKDKGLDESVRLSWRKQSDGKVFHKDDGKTRKSRRRKNYKI